MSLFTCYFFTRSLPVITSPDRGIGTLWKPRRRKKPTSFKVICDLISKFRNKGLLHSLGNKQIKTFRYAVHGYPSSPGQVSALLIISHIVSCSRHCVQLPYYYIHHTMFSPCPRVQHCNYVILQKWSGIQPICTDNRKIKASTNGQTMSKLTGSWKTVSARDDVVQCSVIPIHCHLSDYVRRSRCKMWCTIGLGLNSRSSHVSKWGQWSLHDIVAYNNTIV